MNISIGQFATSAMSTLASDDVRTTHNK